MELKEIFDSWGNAAHARYSKQQLLFSKWEIHEGITWPEEKIEILIQNLQERLSLERNQRLLELGCGGGWLLHALAPSAGYAYGMDFSSGMLKTARELLSNNQLVQGEIGQLPFCKNSIDRILSYYVFLNFADDHYVEQSILEVYRVLKQGGRAVIGQLPDQSLSEQYEQAKESYSEYCQENFTVGESIRDEHKPPLRLFEKEKLKAFLNSHKIQFDFFQSFNPFYRSGQPEKIDWRFDLVLTKS